ncbi:hypothetical protein [Paenibacillus sp. CF384]|uniref:hypothetical protein n=1 Tax=Paenibacillus sp. CF384 TaxID=1884382 RepID=UPI0008970D7D|nr:hypothetical protein [Paenibacillus sp. CF384]SDX95451.1 hypothetical protein SAMN05518855_10317 [Paenibacillus sp. CF384]
MADTLVLFPHCAWGDFPYRPMIESAGRGRAVYVVASAAAMAGAPEGYRAIAPETLADIPWASTAAVVTHPCWIYEIAGRQPEALIMLLPAELEQGDEAYLHCRDALCASASLVVAGSEPFYFEQWFRRDRVFMQDGIDTAADGIAEAAVRDAISGKGVASLAKLQLLRRCDFREEQLKLLLPSAMQTFFQTVYSYLLGDADKAEQLGKAAFERAIFTGDSGAISTYFRFLSAVRLLQGRLSDAIDTYGISAVTDHERDAFSELVELLASGRDKLASALLYRLNDDYRHAAELLLPLVGGAGVDPSVRSRAAELLVEVYMLSGRPDAALPLMEAPPRSVQARLKRLQIEGAVLALQGERHAAVHAMLQAAMTGMEPLKAIAELAAVDYKAHQLAEGEYA